MKKESTTRFKLNPKKPPKSDWRAFDAMTGAERRRAALSDPDSQPATEAQLDAGGICGAISPAAWNCPGLGARRPPPGQGGPGAAHDHCKRSGRSDARSRKPASCGVDGLRIKTILLHSINVNYVNYGDSALHGDN